MEGRRFGHSLTVYNNQMVAIGGYSAGYTNEVWASSDGVVWGLVGLAPFPARRSHTSCVFDNKLWVIGGMDASFTELNDVWHTSNLTDWTCATEEGVFDARNQHTCLTYEVEGIEKMFLIFGSGGTGTGVWSSVDGINWEMVTNDTSAWRFAHSSVIFDNKMWMMGGSDTPQKNDVWNSEDGETWTVVTTNAAFPGRQAHTSVVYNDKMWLIGGEISNVPQNDVWWSEDGINWTCATEEGTFGVRHRFGACVFNDKIWVVGGASSDPPYLGDAWYSPAEE